MSPLGRAADADLHLRPGEDPSKTQSPELAGTQFRNIYSSSWCSMRSYRSASCPPLSCALRLPTVGNGSDVVTFQRVAASGWIEPDCAGPLAELGSRYITTRFTSANLAHLGLSKSTAVTAIHDGDHRSSASSSIVAGLNTSIIPNRLHRSGRHRESGH